jgi:hypothetical protein
MGQRRVSQPTQTRHFSRYLCPKLADHSNKSRGQCHTSDPQGTQLIFQRLAALPQRVARWLPIWVDGSYEGVDLNRVVKRKRLCILGFDVNTLIWL